MPLGRFQQKGLATLAAGTKPMEFWEMPVGVTPDVICTLAAKGLVTASISLTEKGAQALSLKNEAQAAKEARRARGAIRRRMALSKAAKQKTALVVLFVPRPAPALVPAPARAVLEPSQLRQPTMAQLMGSK